ncbi:hypothetical protein GYMLUDRAFT_72273 [Collybiopsis luxurians FD-317 M1]|uniref:Putative gamma-glutamylcyclotransferase n=1 Tax=Collybiopsis luxurians FD-317 M1 TaxID=944289 RepID=A0A0D0BGM9_9AGAR|nr:hypothetical protein GYMLUDRAFT_72273 [Collybiopsis luxurians FD-317 M1]
MATYSSFFYGTLMHPKILKRVIGNDGSHLQIAPAILFEHTRHKVKNADYPGLLPIAIGQKLLDRELAAEERCVRGTLITGLTARDMNFLDYFEGPQYTRRNVQVHPLEPLVDISCYGVDDASFVPVSPPPVPPTSEMPLPIAAQTYIFNDAGDLSAELWSFDDFVKNNAWKWYGAAADENQEITEVDRRRAVGAPSPVEVDTVELRA